MKKTIDLPSGHSLIRKRDEMMTKDMYNVNWNITILKNNTDSSTNIQLRSL